MALGTASVTISIAIAATLFRTTTLQSVSGPTALRVVPALEIAAGLIVGIVAVQLLLSVI